MTLNENDREDVRYVEQDAPGGHVCPFEAGDNLADQDPQAGPWTLLVADRSGTYHAVSELRVIALRDDEVEELESGDESVVDECAGLALGDLLRPALRGYERLEWS